MPTVVVRDETPAGTETGRRTLEFPTEEISVRELIRERIYQEVDDFHRRADGEFRGLVQPTAMEASLNAPSARERRRIDWKDQFAKACEAFERNRILVLVGDRQATSLDDIVRLTRGVEVTFLRLVLLVGG
jgi:hypothetical protein